MNRLAVAALILFCRLSSAAASFPELVDRYFDAYFADRPANASLQGIHTYDTQAYPGHYTQFLWVQSAPTKTRKILGANSNAEGWAHYSEQMMLDEGYGNGDLNLRLGQLQDALLRNARFVVGIQMHRGRVTYDEAIDFFVKEGFTSRANGEREAKRGTGDPTYLYYTLGKLQILKLREDYKKMKGDRFTLQEFHDSFLKQGFPPIKLLRRVLLGEEGAIL